MGSCKLLTLDSKELWKDYLNRLPVEQQDVYFASDYYSLYETRGEGLSCCFVYEDGENFALYPFLMNKINDLGYQFEEEYYDIQGVYGYNGVAATSYDDTFINEFYNCLDKWCLENNVVAEFTRFHPMIKNAEFSNRHRTITKNRETIVLDLSQTEKEIWEKCYSSKNRNMIRKGEKTLTLSVENSLSSFEDFYYMYLKTMKRIGAKNYYFFDKEYFITLFKLLKEHTMIVSAVDKQTGVKLCSLILIIYKNYAHYHLSGREDYIVNNSGNNLILHAAIKIARESNCSFFHFGGGNGSSAEDPLFKFKKQFAPTSLDFSIGFKIFNPTVYNKLIAQWIELHSNRGHSVRNFHNVLRYRDFNFEETENE